jgi:integrase
MPRAPKDTDLSSPTARRRLRPRVDRHPYWKALGSGRFLGYRPATAGPGTWTARVYVSGKYLEGTLVDADDQATADGESILTYRQAVDAALSWCEASAAPRSQVHEPYTVARAAADYLDWYRGHRKAIRDAERRVTADILPTLGDVEVIALTLTQLRHWHQAIADRSARLRPGPDRQKIRETVGPDGERRRKASANRSFTTLRALLNFAVKEGKVPATAGNAWKPLRPFRSVDKPRVRHFSAGEIKRLLNGCEPDFRKLVTGALLTGARYGELRMMHVYDFLLESSCVEVDGKGGRRTIFLNAEGCDFFNGLTAGRESSAWLFLRADGEPWMSHHQNRRMLEIVTAAKIPLPNSFHILRHTYASLYLMAGGSPAGLARQLGHADTRMTLRSYAHLAEAWRAQEAHAHAPSFGLVPSGISRIG